MNIRSLTRGDGVVIGAAVLLFIASFLDIYSVDGATGLDLPSAWASLGPVLMGVVLAGIIGAALDRVSRGLPQPPQGRGLDLGQFGVAFTVFAAWTALGRLRPDGRSRQRQGQRRRPGAGTGLILALVATLVMAGRRRRHPARPGPQGPPGPRPQAARPAALRRRPALPRWPAAPGWLRLPGRRRAAAAVRRPAAQPGQPFGAEAGAAAGRRRRSRRPRTSPRSGSPCRWPRPLFAEDGSPTPIAELAPGTWYLAVEQRGRRWSPRRRTAAAAYSRTPRASSAADAPATLRVQREPRPLALPGGGPLSYSRRQRD